MNGSKDFTKIALGSVGAAKKKLLCQEDFLNRLDHACEANMVFEKNTIKTWLRDLEIPYTEADLDSRATLLKRIQFLPKTRHDILDCILEQLQDLYEMQEQKPVFPDAASFIERLVLQLGDPDLTASGKVRTQILKHFVRYSNEPITQILDLLGISKDSVDEATLLAQMDAHEDAIFDLLQTKEISFYAKFKSLVSALSTKKKFEAKSKWDAFAYEMNWNTTLSALYTACEDAAPSPRDMAQALTELEHNIEKRYANRSKHVSPGSIPAQTAEFITQLLEQTKQLFEQVTAHEVKRDPSLAPLYETKTMYNSRNKDKQQSPCPVLLLANDLAAGRFVPSVTRDYLYKFAIVFGMDVSTPDHTADSTKDIENRLFFDYFSYNKNLFSDAATLAEGSAEGINWKNFAEVTYLYYLHAAMPRKERYIRAEKTIKTLKKAKKSPSRRSDTKYFYEEVICKENLFSLSEDALIRTISRHFDLHPYDSKRDTSYLDYASSQITAQTKIQELKAKIRIAYPITSLGQLLPELNLENQTVQSFAKQLEACAFTKAHVDNWEKEICYLLDKQENEMLTNDEKHFILMHASHRDLPFDDIRGYLMQQKGTAFQKKMLDLLKRMQSLLVQDVKTPSRTDLLILFALDFYDTHLFDSQKNSMRQYAGIISDFEQLKTIFQTSANICLEACRYQPISEKNFLDVFLMFVLYYMNSI